MTKGEHDRKYLSPSLNEEPYNTPHTYDVHKKFI